MVFRSMQGRAVGGGSFAQPFPSRSMRSSKSMLHVVVYAWNNRTAYIVLNGRPQQMTFTPPPPPNLAMSY